MRASSVSRGRSVSLNLSGVPSVSLAHAVTFKQSASGVGPAFWSAGGGTAYLLTVELATWKPRFGAVARLAVLVSDQVSRCVDAPVVLLASSAASVLRKYSVPPACVA